MFFRWLGTAIFLAILAYVSFHYVRLTDFPIGDDPAIHIHTIKATDYRNLLALPYPLPLAIYKFVQQITQIEHAKLFVYLISTYLFLAGVSLAVFVWKSFKNWPLAASAALIFVSSRWVNDGLRMGLLAETFSWSIFFLLLTMLSRRNLIGTLLFSGLLVLSHPFSTVIYIIIFTVYTAVVLVQPSLREERKFIFQVLAGYAALVGIVFLARPDIIQRFLAFKISDPPGWGDRTLEDILLSDDRRRMFIPYVAGLGLFAAMKQWALPGVRIVLFLLIAALFFSLNYLFGISFIPFRFYVYLEMALAIFASYGLWAVVRNESFSTAQTTVLTAALAMLISIPNQAVNQTIGHWQATKPEANAIITSDDRAAIDWLKQDTEPNATIMSTRSRGIWIIALAEKTNVQLVETHYSEEESSSVNAEYLYYAKHQTVPDSVIARYHKVFSNNSVSIWRIDANS